MFGFKKNKATFNESYAEITLRLELGVNDLAGEVAAKTLRDAVTTYIGYEGAIERATNAVDEADMTPQELARVKNKLAEHRKNAAQARVDISEQLNLVRTDARQLSESALTEVARELGVVSASEEETPQEEANISEQLLADAKDSKKEIKQRRLAEKQQEKATGEEAGAFFKAQKSRAEALNSKIDIKTKQAQIKTLNEELTPMLEAQAKTQKVEVATPTEATDAAYKAYQNEQIIKKLDQQLRTPTAEDPGQDLPLS